MRVVTCMHLYDTCSCCRREAGGSCRFPRGAKSGPVETSRPLSACASACPSTCKSCFFRRRLGRKQATPYQPPYSEMVVFVDLEDLEDLEDHEAIGVADDAARGPAGSSLFPQHCFPSRKEKSPARSLQMAEEIRGEEPGEELVKETPNRGNFSAALASYP